MSDLVSNSSGTVSATPTSLAPPPARGADWQNLVFLVALHLGGLIGLFAYWRTQPPSLWLWLMLGGGFVLTTFGISAGYHRLFAHRSYTTSPVLKTLLLLLGAAAVQNSALTWAHKHRLHHQHTDTDRDPYNARRGFWYSHIGWVVQRDIDETCDVSDLETDRWVALQHRWYLPLAMGLGFGLPTLVGWFAGDAWGGLLFGGVWRLLVSYHATFSINSFAHWLGSQPYSSKGTARDNWFAALVTMGEGYHNFHHTFPGDYRNGVRFFDFDPPKWVLAVFAKLGWIRDVRRTPGHVIALRRLKQARLHLESNTALAAADRQHMVAQADKLRHLLTQWSKAVVKNPLTRPPQLMRAADCRREFWRAFNRWEAEVLS